MSCYRYDGQTTLAAHLMQFKFYSNTEATVHTQLLHHYFAFQCIIYNRLPLPIELNIYIAIAEIPFFMKSLQRHQDDIIIIYRNISLHSKKVLVFT